MSNILERIECHLPRMHEDECWITTYKTDRKGYPRTSRNGIAVRLNRIAYEAYYAEPIPDNMQVCHTCDNPNCINPEHLFLGTAQDNVDDMRAKGREYKPGNGFLTNEDYDDIYELDLPTSAIAEIYGISTGHVRRIKRTGSGKQPAA